MNHPPAGTMQAIVGKDTNESGVFTTTDRDRLRDILVGEFQAKNYDPGLQSAVDFWQQKVRGNASDNAGAAASPGAGCRQHVARPYRFPNETGTPGSHRPRRPRSARRSLGSARSSSGAC